MEQIQKKVSVLNMDSLHAKIYRWFYCKEKSAMPKGLCPYFWSSIIMWLIIFPYSIFVLPIIVIEALRNDYTNGEYPSFVRALLALFFYLCCLTLFVLSAPILNIFYHYGVKSFMNTFVCGGYVFWVFGLLVGLVYLISYVVKKIKSSISGKKYDEFGRRIWEEKQPNLLIEFIKAQYEKRCPRIEWKNKDKSEDLNLDNNGQ